MDEKNAICQIRLPMRPWAQDRLRRLPGISSVAPGEWLIADEAFADQLAYRNRLIATRREEVLRLSREAGPAAGELLDTVLAELEAAPGYERRGEAVLRPDGVCVAIDRDDPLATAGRLVQEDLVLLDRPGDAPEHLVIGAVLCFPASWTLSEKYLRPLTRIHVPVKDYDADIARRVQRLFDGLQVDRPIWRANFMVYADPELHQPRREGETRQLPAAGAGWLRMERQVLRRLEKTRAVVFSIHTYVLPLAALAPEDQAALADCAPVA